MLRRYLIINAVTTAMLYGAFLAFMPNITGSARSFQQSIETFAMDSALIGPLVHRVVVVFSSGG